MRMNMFLSAVFLLAAVLLPGCGGEKETPKKDTKPPVTVAPKVEEAVAAPAEGSTASSAAVTPIDATDSSEPKPAEASGTEVSKPEASGTETSKMEASGTEVSKPEASGTETSKMEASGTEEAPNALVGTSWKLGEYEAVFKDNTTVLVKGGPIADLSPDGIEGTYTLVDGVLEVSVMGETRVGTFDGEKMVVDGSVGELMQ